MGSQQPRTSWPGKRKNPVEKFYFPWPGNSATRSGKHVFRNFKCREILPVLGYLGSLPCRKILPYIHLAICNGRQTKKGTVLSINKMRVIVPPRSLRFYHFENRGLVSKGLGPARAQCPSAPALRRTLISGDDPFLSARTALALSPCGLLP